MCSPPPKLTFASFSQLPVTYNLECWLISFSFFKCKLSSLIIHSRGFPGGLAVKNPSAVQEMQGTQVRSPGWEDPLEKEMATHSSILPGKSHGQRSLAGYGPWGHKESDLTEATEHFIVEYLTYISVSILNNIKT